LEEETNVNTYIVKQKLPKEIDTRDKEVEILHLILSEPAMSREDLDALNSKVTSPCILN
jgi:intraflagellar transport protein 81